MSEKGYVGIVFHIGKFLKMVVDARRVAVVSLLAFATTADFARESVVEEPSCECAFFVRRTQKAHQRRAHPIGRASVMGATVDSPVVPIHIAFPEPKGPATGFTLTVGRPWGDRWGLLLLFVLVLTVHVPSRIRAIVVC